MGNKHKTYSNEFKFKVALAALKGNKTISQLCTEYQLTPSVIPDFTPKEVMDVYNAGGVLTGIKKLKI